MITALIHSHYGDNMTTVFETVDAIIQAISIAVEMCKLLYRPYQDSRCEQVWSSLCCKTTCISYGNYGGYIYFSKSSDLANKLLAMPSVCWQPPDCLALSPFCWQCQWSLYDSYHYITWYVDILQNIMFLNI